MYCPSYTVHVDIIYIYTHTHVHTGTCIYIQGKNGFFSRLFSSFCRRFITSVLIRIIEYTKLITGVVSKQDI